PTFTGTRVEGQTTNLIGLRAALQLPHRFALGVAGAGFVTTQTPMADFPPEAGYDLRGGYGGVLIERGLFSSHGIELAANAILGAGGACVVTHATYTRCLETQSFWVAEPEGTLSIGLAPSVRVAVGAGYRFTSDDAFSGPSVSTSLMFGQFRRP